MQFTVYCVSWRAFTLEDACQFSFFCPLLQLREEGKHWAGMLIQQVLYLLLRKVAFFLIFAFFFLWFQGTRCWDKTHELAIDLLPCLLPSVCLTLGGKDRCESAMDLRDFRLPALSDWKTCTVTSILAPSEVCGHGSVAQGRMLTEPFFLHPYFYTPASAHTGEAKLPLLALSTLCSPLLVLLPSWGLSLWKNFKGIG